MMAMTGARVRLAARSWRRTTPMRVSSDPADVESVTIRYLMYVLLPAWFVPGIADYWMHRRTRIERTSGLRESAIHALDRRPTITVRTVLAIPIALGLVALFVFAALNSTAVPGCGPAAAPHSKFVIEILFIPALPPERCSAFARTERQRRGSGHGS